VEVWNRETSLWAANAPGERMPSDGVKAQGLLSPESGSPSPFDAQLIHDVFDVMPHCFDADPENDRNLWIGLPLSHPTQHLGLPTGEPEVFENRMRQTVNVFLKDKSVFVDQVIGHQSNRQRGGFTLLGEGSQRTREEAVAVRKSEPPFGPAMKVLRESVGFYRAKEAGHALRRFLGAKQ